MRRNLLRIMIFVLLLMCTTIGGSIGNRTASAQTLPVIYVHPEINQGPVGSNFTIDINIANVTLGNTGGYGVIAWEFDMIFDPDVLNVTGIMEGPWLKSGGDTILSESIDNNTGTVVVTNFLYDFPEPGVVGSGTLANVTFLVIAEGECLLHFDKTLLRAWNGTSLQVIDHSAVDGFFSYVHDVAVIDVIPAADQAYPTWTIPLNITVTVLNNATAPANFTVTAYYENVTAAYEIETQNVTNLSAGSQLNLTFSWNLTDVGWGLYTIKANVTLTGDINPANDEFVYSDVTIKIPGDIQGDPGDPDPTKADGDVDRYDFGAFALAFGYLSGQPGYNVECDVDRSGKVDRYDFGIFALNYGKSTPKYP